MIRKLMLAAPLACLLALPGCGTNPATITATIKVVQDDAVAVCGFLPSAATVANILTAGNPLVATASAIAEAICAAVVPAQSLRGKRRGASATVIEPQTGVEIHGRFVR